MKKLTALGKPFKYVGKEQEEEEKEEASDL